MPFRLASNYMKVEHPRLFSYADCEADGEVLDLEVAGTWYPFAGPWADNLVKNFTITSAGVITFSGYASIFLYLPSTVFSTNKSCIVTFGTFLNDVLKTQTAITVGASETEKELSSRKTLYELVPGDTLQLKAKSDTTDTALTTTTNRLLFT